MLLVSSITPSGSAWVTEAALASLPGARVFELDEFDDRDAVRSLASMFNVTGATVTTVDGHCALTSTQRTASLVAAFEHSAVASEPTVVLVRGSVPQLVADLGSLAVVLQVGAPGHELTDRLMSMASAASEGGIEWLLATPPEQFAITTATAQVAQGSALGLSVRGVLVAPMPRKSDGWPKHVRDAARESVTELADRLFGVSVLRSRAGAAPAFPAPDSHRLETSVTMDSGGEYLLSGTIPGGQFCDLEVGVWSMDPSYPSTHLVLRLDGVTVWRSLDPTLRRCVGVEAVVAGDTISVPFVPDPGQWPSVENDDEGEAP